MSSAPTLYKDDFITITRDEVCIREMVYSLADLNSVSVRLMRRNLVPLLFIGAMLLFTLVTLGFDQLLNNIFYVSLLIAPVIIYYLTSRRHCVLHLDTTRGNEYALATRDQAYLHEIAGHIRAVVDARPDHGNARHPKARPGDYLPQVPAHCPACNTVLTLETTRWEDAQNASCPQCGHKLPVSWRVAI